MSSRPKNPKYARNKNVLVIGGSGSARPLLAQAEFDADAQAPTSLPIPRAPSWWSAAKCSSGVRPSWARTGKPVKDKNGKIVYEPYQIKVLNTINFKKSMHYNPFAYIHSEKDILKLVTTLIANTKGEGKAGDDFWVKGGNAAVLCAHRLYPLRSPSGGTELLHPHLR